MQCLCKSGPWSALYCRQHLNAPSLGLSLQAHLPPHSLWFHDASQNRQFPNSTKLFPIPKPLTPFFSSPQSFSKLKFFKADPSLPTGHWLTCLRCCVPVLHTICFLHSPIPIANFLCAYSSCIYSHAKGMDCSPSTKCTVLADQPSQHEQKYNNHNLRFPFHLSQIHHRSA